MSLSNVEWDRRIREAIASKRLVRIRYQGKTRVVEPHDYGLRDERRRLFVYQRFVDAGPSTGSRWRNLFVDEIEELVLLDETFPGTRADAHAAHQRWDVVYARVT
jgi:predicted DNA-binding transcriptional regulator YafY